MVSDQWCEPPLPNSATNLRLFGWWHHWVFAIGEPGFQIIFLLQIFSSWSKEIWLVASLSFCHCRTKVSDHLFTAADPRIFGWWQHWAFATAKLRFQIIFLHQSFSSWSKAIWMVASLILGQWNQGFRASLKGDFQQLIRGYLAGGITDFVTAEAKFQIVLLL